MRYSNRPSTGSWATSSLWCYSTRMNCQLLWSKKVHKTRLNWQSITRNSKISSKKNVLSYLPSSRSSRKRSSTSLLSKTSATSTPCHFIDGSLLSNTGNGTSTIWSSNTPSWTLSSLEIQLPTSNNWDKSSSRILGGPFKPWVWTSYCSSSPEIIWRSSIRYGFCL